MVKIAITRSAWRLAVAGVLVLGVSGPVVAGMKEGSVALGRGDYKTAYEEFLPLAKAGNTDARYWLGVMYEIGQGVPQDYAEAAKWYRKAAVQGLAEAQNNLGVMYREGEGVPHDHVLAYMWWTLAAVQGSEQAAKNLDVAAKLMTPADISKAQKMAREWKPKK